MNINFFETKKQDIKIIKELLKYHNLNFSSEILTENNTNKLEKTEILSVFINSKINKKILEKLPNLKYITTRSTGYDHIDLEECKKRGVLVSNVPNYGENTVAEHAFALLLSLSRRVNQGEKQIKNKEVNLEVLPCFDLKDRTIGIIGAGRIGQHMIKMAKGFEMKVIAYDIYQNQKVADEIGFSYVSLDELLKESDIISIHTLLTEKTRHLLNKDSFKKMKPSVIIINTARGEIIDISELVKALKKEKIAGAGLDVFEHESILLQDKKTDSLINFLLNNKNVIMTPHMAFYSHESLQRILSTTIENIKNFANNKHINVVQN